jgi:hypothetical protein
MEEDELEAARVEAAAERRGETGGKDFFLLERAKFLLVRNSSCISIPQLDKHFQTWKV